MSESEHGYQHGPAEHCRCIVSPGCLREVRRRRMVSLDAVTALSGYSREYLSGLERGDSAACVVAEVLQAYEEAMGVPVEVEVLAMIGDFLRAMWSGHEMLTRLYRHRAPREQIGQESAWLAG